MKTLALLTLLLSVNAAYSQPDSCLEATPFQYFHCETYQATTTHSATLCYSFHTAGSFVDFNFGYFAYCPDLTVEYTLYNGLCDSIMSNTTGYFNIAPEVYYVICGNVSCNDTTGLGIAQVCTAELLTLPVEFLSMTAFPVDAGVVLQWETASEHNSQAFAIYRTLDFVQWSALVQVPGSGNSYTRKAYRWTDTQPMNGLMYYRLDGIDFDGQTRTLMILPVRWKGESKSSLGVFDLLGRKVK